MSMNSNLDDIFTRKLKNIFLNRKKEASREVDEYIRLKKKEYTDQYNSYLKENQTEINNAIKKYELVSQKEKTKLNNDKKKILN